MIKGTQNILVIVRLLVYKSHNFETISTFLGTWLSRVENLGLPLFLRAKAWLGSEGMCKAEERNENYPLYKPLPHVGREWRLLNLCFLLGSSNMPCSASHCQRRDREAYGFVSLFAVVNKTGQLCQTIYSSSLEGVWQQAGSSYRDAS